MSDRFSGKRKRNIGADPPTPHAFQQPNSEPDITTYNSTGKLPSYNDLLVASCLLSFHEQIDSSDNRQADAGGLAACDVPRDNELATRGAIGDHSTGVAVSFSSSNDLHGLAVDPQIPQEQIPPEPFRISEAALDPVSRNANGEPLSYSHGVLDTSSMSTLEQIDTSEHRRVSGAVGSLAALDALRANELAESEVIGISSSIAVDLSRSSVLATIGDASLEMALPVIMSKHSRRSRNSSKFFHGIAFNSALSSRPELSLAAYNQAPTLPDVQLPQVILRTTVVLTSSDSVVDALSCTFPFTSPNTASHLVPVLGLHNFDRHLRAAMSALRTSGASPLPVRVPIAVSDCPASDSTSILRPMLYVPDESDDTSGWLITIERWEERLEISIPSALSSRPDLCLAAYNQQPTVTAAQLPRVILRITAVPTVSDSVVDTLACTLPFTGLSNVTHLEPVLGLRNVRDQLQVAMSALRTSGSTPLPVRVPIAVSDSPASDGASILRPMLYMHDDSDDASGWLITIERWEEWLDLVATPSKFLRGRAFNSACASRPDLCLAAYNQQPTVIAAHLPRVVLRTTAVPTTSDSVVDVLACTYPFISPNTVSQLEPLLGTISVGYQLRGAMSALRTSGSAPFPVRVPIAVSDCPASDGASILRPMLYVPDDSDDASGWLITIERWEERLEIFPSKLLRGSAFNSALSSRPDMNLVAYNQAPTLTDVQLPQVILRTTVVITSSDSVVDALSCTFPFTNPNTVSHLVPVLGLNCVERHLRAAMSALRISGSTPLLVRVPIAVSDCPASGSASILRPMLYVPDDGDDTSGWLITIERLKGKRSNVAISKLLRGPAFYAALSLRPDLSLAAYNKQPAVTAAQLPRVILRTTAVPTGSNSVVDALACTPPFVNLSKLSHLEPVLGVTRVEKQQRAAMSALRTSGVDPLPVRVPIAVSDCPASGSASILRPMLYVRDGSDVNSGWLMAIERWE